jgi:hypothetical protein
MKKSIAPASPEAYVASLNGWQRRYVEALRAAATAAAPTLEEVIKWGHLVYFSNGPVLLIRAETSGSSSGSGAASACRASSLDSNPAASTKWPRWS